MSGILYGYASVFGVPDLSGDVVARGAFQNIKPDAVKMLYQHDLTRPIGRWLKMEETAYGLWVEGYLTPQVQLASETASLIVNGALDGLSIGFRVIKSLRGENAPSPNVSPSMAGVRVRRHLQCVELVEISIVTLPMQPRAKITKFTTLMDSNKAGKEPSHGY